MELPKWNGWTIDLKLKQFRRVGREGALGIEFVEFNSVEGREILKEYCEYKYNYHMEEGSVYQRIVFDIEEGSFSNEDAEIIANEMFHGAHGEKG